MPYSRNRKDKVWLNMAAGAIGGLCGAWAMNRFQAGISKLKGNSAAGSVGSRDQQPQQQREQQEPATMKAGEKILVAVTGHHLTAPQKKIVEPLVHYGFGTLIGAAYGALVSKAPVANAGAGTVYGAAVWLLADEIGVPAAGLSKPAAQTPWPQHLQALGSHLVYGLTTEGVRWLAGRTIPA